MKNENKNATIYDIAEKAGVSAATVSKVLNQKGSISSETQKKIMDIVSDLGYQPNPAARYLKTMETKQIMLSIPMVGDLFFLSMIQKVQSICKANGYSLLINSTEESEDEEIKMLSNLGNNFIDGLILVSVNYTEKHLKMIKRINRPVVLCSIGCEALDKFETACDFVGVDAKKGIVLSINHLIKQGHTKIGYVGQDINCQTGRERYNGFIAAMEENNLEVNQDYVLSGEVNEAFGYEAGMKFLELENRPTALCVSADHIVIGMYQAFDEKSFDVANELAIIGMDDISICKIMKPKLSSVNLAQSDIGTSATELLMKRIEGDNHPYKSIIYQPEMRIRQSSLYSVINK